MSVEIQERGGEPIVVDMYDGQDDGRLHIHLSSRWTLARVNSWSLREGIGNQVLPADDAMGKDYHYIIDQSCDLMAYIEVGTSRLFEHFYHWDGYRIEEPNKETFMARWRVSHPVHFGDIRSVVARAMETTEHEDIKQHWSLCRRGLIWMDQETPEFEPALHYVMDYLDRFLEREAMAPLQGTRSQQQWARKVRLRVIQRLGLLHDDHTDMRARIDCKFARLSARSIPESGTWIGVSDTIKAQPTHETVAWLLSGW